MLLLLSLLVDVDDDARVGEYNYSFMTLYAKIDINSSFSWAPLSVVFVASGKCKTHESQNLLLLLVLHLLLIQFGTILGRFGVSSSLSGSRLTPPQVLLYKLELSAL